MNNTWHPLSTSVAIETSEYLSSPGSTCPFLAPAGSADIGRMQSWVVVILVPLADRAVIGLVVGLMSVPVLHTIKWRAPSGVAHVADAPESATPYL